MTADHHLERFLEAQDPVFERVLSELRSGRKTSHWMWFIFPQADGLGSSETARFYAIRSPDEARAYADHPLLGGRLRECCRILLKLPGHSAHAIFGTPDDLKLRSCLTLFAETVPEEPVFREVLDRYYRGLPDSRTKDILRQWAGD